MFSNCNDDQGHDPPKISFIQQGNYVFQDTNLAFGKNFKVGVSLQNNGLNITNYLIKLDTGNGFQTVFDTGMNTPSIEVINTLTKTNAQTDVYFFIARDIEGNKSELQITVTKDESATFQKVRFLENITLHAQNKTNAEAFYSFGQEKSYDFPGAFSEPGKVDLFYYYISGDENVISSPGANIEAEVFEGKENYDVSNWSVRNTTRFKTTSITTMEFDEIKNDSLLIASYGTSDGKRKSKKLKQGDIYSFKTQNAKFGMFKVLEVQGKDSGFVRIHVKIQP